MQYQQKNKKYLLLKLESGEEIIDSLSNLALKENISCASITGIGAINNVEIGFFNLINKKYNKKRLEGEYEITSLNGNISIKDNIPFVHLHINVSDKECKVFGGHLFNANITVSGEFFIRLIGEKLDRNYDDNIGLHLWDLRNCE